MSETVQPYVLVATVARDDATTTLFFGHLRNRVPVRIAESVPRSMRQLVQSFKSELAIAPQLAGASALVINRGLFEFRSLAGCARDAAIPCYYFIDDNFIVLSGEGNADVRTVGSYTTDNVRRALQEFDGVLCATDSLRAYFLDHRLHPQVFLYPPVAFASDPAPRRSRERLHVGFFGGAHRREPFMRLVLPAIEQLAALRPVTLFAAGVDIPQRAGNGLEIVLLPYDRRYSAAIDAMAKNEIDILVHPTSITDNNLYKNPHVLINARALGAAPVFSDAPPYDALGNGDVCLLTRDTTADWFEALSRLDDADLRSAMAARIDAFCDRHFSGDLNVRCLAGLLAARREDNHPSVRSLRWRLARGFVHDLSRRLLKAA